MRSSIGIALVVFALHAPVRGNDWPQWLGPSRNGVSKETAWSSDWKGKTPKVLWQGKSGLGYSSFAIAKGNVYTLGHGDDRETIYCFDAATGEVKWRHSYNCARIAKFYEGGSSSTPTIDGDTLYSVGKEGQFFSLDAATGKLNWEINLKDELDAGVPEWGYACSPLVLGDLVIVQANCTAAYDKKTGKRAWKTGKFQQAYGSPISFGFQGKTLIADLNSEGLIVVDAKDGKVLAQTGWRTQFDTNASTPIIHDGRIFISTGYGKGCGLFEFTGAALKEIYTSKTMANHMNNCVLWEGHLYGIHGNSHDRNSCTLRCIDLATGEKKWEQRGFGCGSLTLADGKLIIFSDRCDLVIAEATPTKYTEVSRFDQVMRGKSWTTPILSHGRVYCRSVDGTVVCLDVSK